MENSANILNGEQQGNYPKARTIQGKNISPSKRRRNDQIEFVGIAFIPPANDGKTNKFKVQIVYFHLKSSILEIIKVSLIN